MWTPLPNDRGADYEKRPQQERRHHPPAAGGHPHHVGEQPQAHELRLLGQPPADPRNSRRKGPGDAQGPGRPQGPQGPRRPGRRQRRHRRLHRQRRDQRPRRGGGQAQGEDRGPPGGAGRLHRPRRHQARGQEPHQHGDGLPAPQGQRPPHHGPLPPHGLLRQSRHRQDHRGPADGENLPLSRHPLPGPAGGGGPQRPRGRIRGPDRHQDPQGHRERSRRRPLHRRGLRPQRKLRERLRPGGHRHHFEGHGGPPGRSRGHRGGLRRADGRLHPLQPRSRVPVQPLPAL